MKPNTRLRWGGRNLEIENTEIPLTINNSNAIEEGFHAVNLSKVMVNSTDFKLLVKAHVIDSKQCAGNESFFTYNGKFF